MITKAIIPIAGRATRHEPLSRVVPKALLPLPHPAGLAVPVVHWICAEAAAAGVQQVLLIVSPAQQRMVEMYFAAAAGMTRPHPLALPERIRMIVQAEPTGFGGAVMLAAAEVAGEPFLLMLGDHVYAHSRGAGACAAQVAAAMQQHGEAVAMIGVQEAGADDLPLVGVAGGRPFGGRVYQCSDFVEKPDLATARSRLVTPGLGGRFLAHCGIYAFGPQIFDCLSALAAAPRAAGSELELAAAQSMLLERHPQQYLLYHIDGLACDTGTPEGYAATFAAFASQGTGR